MKTTVQETKTTRSRTIYITDYDRERLEKVLERAKDVDPFRADLKDLEAELSRAKVVKPKAVPNDVITMNSKVCLLDRDEGDELIYTLAFPEDANASEGKISILAPIGTAMLGHRVGETFQWKIPDGIVTLEVKEVLYQPEAAGDYDL